MQHEIVIGLKQWIAEISKGNSFFTFKTALDGFLGQQIVHAEVFSDVAQEFHYGDGSEPVSIINDLCRIVSGAEVEKAAELLFNAGEIFFDLFARQQLPLFCLATGIANQTGAAAGDGDRRVAKLL